MKTITDEQMIRVLAEEMEFDGDLSFMEGTCYISAPCIAKGTDRSWTAWNPLTDANDTLMVIEAIAKRGFNITVSCHPNGMYYTTAQDRSGDIYETELAHTFQRAASLAAIKAIAENKSAK